MMLTFFVSMCREEVFPFVCIKFEGKENIQTYNNATIVLCVGEVGETILLVWDHYLNYSLELL